VKRISGVLITHNEENKIRTALESLEDVCDEILVVDSFSQDRTPEICNEFSVQFHQRRWNGFVNQKQFATDLATHDWVLSLDADEKLSPELQKELLEWKESKTQENGYLIPRLTYFLNRFIYHTSWYPDYQMRLFRKSEGSWKGRRVHESFSVSEPIGKMTNQILHFTYASVSEYLVQLERFSTLVAADYQDRGRKAGLTRLLFYPPIVFLKNYLVKRGFLDGIPGIAVSFLAAASTFFNYLKLWELQHDLTTKGPQWDHIGGKKTR